MSRWKDRLNRRQQERLEQEAEANQKKAQADQDALLAQMASSVAALSTFPNPTLHNGWSTATTINFPNWSSATFINPYAPTGITFGGGITVGPGAPPVPLGAPPGKPLPVEQRTMPVIGYRAWNWAGNFVLGRGMDGKLGSTGTGGFWEAATADAECRANGKHTAPDQFCSCGLYVLADLDTVLYHTGLSDFLVVGAVMGWGKVIQHGAEGWRAEHVRILGLLDCKYSETQYRNTEAAARKYKLEIYERDSLEQFVKEWGDPL